MYSKEELLDGLNTQVVGKKLFVFDSLDSTNTCAKALAETEMEEGTVVVADFQTEGKGRMGRSWLSEKGQNILFSCILRPSLNKELAGLLTFFAAVSIARALETATGKSVECKWPNDLLINGKKCCGILLENSFEQDKIAYAVVGVGINVNQKAFDTSLNMKATSLRQETGKHMERKTVFQTILQEMDRQYTNVAKGKFENIMSEWNKRCKMFGKQTSVSQDGNVITGTALSLSADGGLVLNTPQGTHTVYAGDVTVIA